MVLVVRVSVARTKSVDRKSVRPRSVPGGCALELENRALKCCPAEVRLIRSGTTAVAAMLPGERTFA